MLLVIQANAQNQVGVYHRRGVGDVLFVQQRMVFPCQFLQFVQHGLAAADYLIGAGRHVLSQGCHIQHTVFQAQPQVHLSVDHHIQQLHTIPPYKGIFCSPSGQRFCQL